MAFMVANVSGGLVLDGTLQAARPNKMMDAIVKNLMFRCMVSSVLRMIFVDGGSL